MSKYEVLQGFYAVHDELGSGGFGKVRLATHLLTNQKVAIKIIDKKQLGHDLPRVQTEMDALRNLSHQNICRLYHYIETEDKFFIVMEYCSGGEMFDYIVRKERLEESEARHFFRQLVSAIAFVHSQGYAHRDLKPENLLLTEDLHLKLIDFGLCAKTEKGRIDKHNLDTCCGSPAYAAPELIQGLQYKGNEADVWSMGILLYTLLVGALPFEDDNMQIMYKKIQSGCFYEPEFLSPLSKQLLRAMLQVVPERRISVKKLLEHDWLNHKYTQPVKWNTIYDKNFIDRDVARVMSKYYGFESTDKMIEKIKEWNFDYMTSTYYALLHRKRNGMEIILPMVRNSTNTAPPNVQNILCSPTIHASLENNLDKSGLEDDDSDPSSISSSSDISARLKKNCVVSDESSSSRFVKPMSPAAEKDKKMSYVNAMLTMPSQFTGRSPLRIPESPMSVRSSDSASLGSAATPSRGGVKDNDKENASTGKNYRMGASTCKSRGPLKITGVEEGTMKSVYTTPNTRPTLRGLFSPGNAEHKKRQRARSSDRASIGMPPGSPVSIGSAHSANNADGRTPRSRIKTNRLPQRVFTSLERKKEKLITLLTPRKMQRDSPQVLKDVKNMVNVSMTASQDPEEVRNLLKKVFDDERMRYELNGWKFLATQETVHGWMTVELEIVRLQMFDKVGIRRKRLKGDAFMYKKVCEKILQMAKIE
ncbi:Maternal embryonic leucine zipper kinase [Caenorhabditis elegans]|uniref:Isoform a of Maternal embryonic leucine zipper kinase n=2 Tax=Caenorhabditis elegans TaxID=6239 RepID=U4PR86-2|nr:Maternal embryonic leucine zipper kinase [Caenorhabditis elegans]CCD69087.1 Maternal embryonic leucine zipper kinase [Caenorhabditis elegans]|eukprot:NP_001023420.2 Maternal embryonic leucine zipper kinase [Caenorhabditis elegans]